MLKTMYYHCLSYRTDWRCLSVLEINDHFLKWYRAYLNSNPAANGNFSFPGPGPVPGLPPGLPMPPVLYPRFSAPLPPYSMSMSSMPPPNLQPDVLSSAEFSPDTHAEPTARHENFTPHLHNQPLMPNGMMVPERQYYPRNILPLPEEPFREYMPVYPGYQEPMPQMYDNASYMIEGRELPPEPRPDFRMEPNYVMVNREQRRIEQTWPSVNEAFFEGVGNVMPPFTNNTEDIFGSGDRRVVGADRIAANDRLNNYSRADEQELEEELEALARRIDTEFKNAD